jgi:hypothetical protein
MPWPFDNGGFAIDEAMVGAALGASVARSSGALKDRA